MYNTLPKLSATASTADRWQLPNLLSRDRTTRLVQQADQIEGIERSSHPQRSAGRIQVDRCCWIDCADRVVDGAHVGCRIAQLNSELHETFLVEWTPMHPICILQCDGRAAL
jgi:hypothetical protein